MTFAKHLGPIAICLLLAFTASPAAAACLGAQSAREAVSSGAARPLGSLAVSGKIVSAKLCRQNGRLVYILSVLSGGSVAKIIVDARSGQRIG